MAIGTDFSSCGLSDAGRVAGILLLGALGIAQAAPQELAAQQLHPHLDTIQVDRIRIHPLTPQGDTILTWPSPELRERELRRIFPGLHWGAFPAPRVFGLRMTDLEPELGRYFGREEGVLVLEVEDDAPLPIRPGDVILRVGDRSVRDARHVAEILGSYRSGEEVRVEVWRHQEAVTVEGRVP